MLDKFKRNKKYMVVKAWQDQPFNERFRIRQLRYELKTGEVLRFRSKNIGKAEFLDNEGKLVILDFGVAFAIMDDVVRR
jgi:hypothetical protein